MKKATGRPPKLRATQATIKTIIGLGKIQATTKECAAVLDVTEPTFIKFKSDHPQVAEAFEAGKSKGLISLRRKQWALASKNAGMAIFLGKNYLNQTDRQELSGPDGGAIKTQDIGGNDLARRIALILAEGVVKPHGS